MDTATTASQVSDAATQTTGTGMSVLMSWIMTPVGATLFLMLLACGILKFVKRGVRWVTGLFSVVCVLVAVWILGGVLEAWGIPVREWIRTYVPMFGQDVLNLIENLFSVASS